MSKSNLSADDLIVLLDILPERSPENAENIIDIIIDGWDFLLKFEEPKKIKFFLKVMTLQLSASFIQRLFLKTNENGWNILIVLSTLKDWDLLEYVLDLAMKVGGANLPRILVNAVTLQGEHILHILCKDSTNNIEYLTNMFNWIITHLRAITLEDLIGFATTNGDNFLMYCSRHKKSMEFFEIFRLVKGYFNDFECINWLKAVDDEGKNFFFIHAQQNDFISSILLIFKCASFFYESTFYEKVFGWRGANQTILHYIIENVDCFIDNLANKEIDSLLIEQVFVMNAWHGKCFISVLSDEKIPFQNVLLVMVEKYSPLTICNILAHDNGSPILIKYLRAASNHLSEIHSSFQWVQQHLPAVVFEMLCNRAINQNTFHRNDPNGTFRIFLGRLVHDMDFIGSADLQKIIHFLEVYSKCPFSNFCLHCLYVLLEKNMHQDNMKKLLFIEGQTPTFIHFMKWVVKSLGGDCVVDLLTTNQGGSSKLFKTIFLERGEFTPLEILKWMNEEFNENFFKKILTYKTMDENKIPISVLRSWNIFDNSKDYVEIKFWLLVTFGIPFFKEIISQEMMYENVRLKNF